jgi:hypothetical protein
MAQKQGHLPQKTRVVDDLWYTRAYMCMRNSETTYVSAKFTRNITTLSLLQQRVLSAYDSCYERLGRNLKSPKTVKETNFNTTVVLDYGLDE